jgi:ribosomal protein L34E
MEHKNKTKNRPYGAVWCTKKNKAKTKTKYTYMERQNL